MNKITVTAAYGDGEKVNIKINNRKLIDGSDAVLFGNDFYIGSKMTQYIIQCHIL